MLEVDGQTMDVLVKEIDFSPLKTEIYEIDFQALVSGEKVHSVAEVILLNHEKVNTDWSTRRSTRSLSSCTCRSCRES